jgi:hypothetical protein
MSSHRPESDGERRRPFDHRDVCHSTVQSYNFSGTMIVRSIVSVRRHRRDSRARQKVCLHHNELRHQTRQRTSGDKNAPQPAMLKCEFEFNQSVGACFPKAYSSHSVFQTLHFAVTNRIGIKLWIWHADSNSERNLTTE